MRGREDGSEVFEILVRLQTQTEFGVENRWYLTASDNDKYEAEKLYANVQDRYGKDPRVLVVLALNRLDPGTGRYRLNIVQATGRAPMIEDVHPMDRITERRIQTALSHKADVHRAAASPRQATARRNWSMAWLAALTASAFLAVSASACTLMH